MTPTALYILKAFGDPGAGSPIAPRQARRIEDDDKPTVRVNITLPEDVLAAIDKIAKRLGMTRSGFIARAAKKDMAA